MDLFALLVPCFDLVGHIDGEVFNDKITILNFPRPDGEAGWQDVRVALGVEVKVDTGSIPNAPIGASRDGFDGLFENIEWQDVGAFAVLVVGRGSRGLGVEQGSGLSGDFNEGFVSV